MFSHHDWKPRDLSGKPFAILFSSFRETILIHTGTLFLHNPEVLFDDPGYKMTGALFFKSPRIMAESERLFLQRVLPNPMPDVVKQSPFWTGKPGQLQDSNVVLVDKRQHFISLLLVCQTNGPDGDRYRSSDTKGVRKPFPVSTEAQNSHCVDEPISHLGEFWLGWELSGNHNYSFHEGNLGIMRGAVLNEPFVARRRSKYYHRTTDGTVAGQQAMTSNAKERDNVNDTLPYRLRICAPQLVHLDLDGRPLWFAGGLLNSGSAAKGQTGYHTFCSFMVEQSDLEEETAWEFQRGDVYCLTSPPDLVSELKKEEDRILDIIVALTTKIDADEEDSD